MVRTGSETQTMQDWRKLSNVVPADNETDNLKTVSSRKLICIPSCHAASASVIALASASPWGETLDSPGLCHFTCW